MMMIDDASPYVISIHALREESDGLVCWVISLITDFNPRSP